MVDEVDKKFVYALIGIFVFTLACLVIIGGLQDLVESGQRSSWYIYCDLELKSCSCNIYGDAPVWQEVACMNFMQDYYSGESGVPNSDLIGIN